MLSDTGAADLAIDHIAAIPALHEEVRAALPAIVERAKPCGPQAVIVEVGKLFAIYPQPVKSEGEWEAFWEFYIDDLEDLPLEALRAGLRDARRQAGAEFLPKPGPLRALALKHAEPILKAQHRAVRAARTEPPRQLDKGDVKANVAEIGAVLDTLAATAAADPLKASAIAKRQVQP